MRGKKYIMLFKNIQIVINVRIYYKLRKELILKHATRKEEIM